MSSGRFRKVSGSRTRGFLLTTTNLDKLHEFRKVNRHNRVPVTSVIPWIWKLPQSWAHSWTISLKNNYILLLGRAYSRITMFRLRGFSQQTWNPKCHFVNLRDLVLPQECDLAYPNLCPWEIRSSQTIAFNSRQLCSNLPLILWSLRPERPTAVGPFTILGPWDPLGWDLASLRKSWNLILDIWTLKKNGFYIFKHILEKVKYP